MGLIEAGLHQRVLVIGTEVLSQTVDYTDRSTCILFGDGAGAMLLEADDRRDSFMASLSATTGIRRRSCTVAPPPTELRCGTQRGWEIGAERPRTI